MVALLFGDMLWKARRARIACIGLIVMGGCYLLGRVFYETRIVAPIPSDLASTFDLVAPAVLIVASALRVFLHYRTPQKAGA